MGLRLQGFNTYDCVSEEGSVRVEQTLTGFIKSNGS